MKNRINKTVLIFFVCTVMAFSLGLKKPVHPSDLTAQDLTAQVSKVFAQNCISAGCHSGRFPPMELNLGEDKFAVSLLNVSSRQVSDLKLVDTTNTEKSYLLLKLRGDDSITGKPMPYERDPLSSEEIFAIEKWILGFERKEDAEQPATQKDQAYQERRFTKPAFWGTRLMNLPTDMSIGNKDFLFRISHRFIPAVSKGYDSFYGFDGPAVIYFSMGYGITDTLSFTLGRSSFLKEFELSLKWVFLEQKKISLPLSAFLYLGGGLTTLRQEDRSTFGSENTRFIAQLGLTYQFSNSFSILLVPSYASNTNYEKPNSENTLALGLGSRLTLVDNLSLVAEWVPVLSGYEANSSSWGLGLEWKIGGHVFQIFGLNSFGLPTAQYLPGGDLRLSENDFRFGFSIFRFF
jgi:hypothetical protein